MCAKNRNYASGAIKRKLQARREQEAVKTRKVMENYLLKELQRNDPQQENSKKTYPYVGVASIMRESLDDGDVAIDSQAQSSQDCQKGQCLFFQNGNSNFFPKVNIYSKQRGLSENAFRFVLPSEEVCNRSWLLFSPWLETLFCFPCVLFTDASDNMRSTLSETGISFNQFRKQTV